MITKAQARNFASLYVRGPEGVRGDWTQTAFRSGLGYVPPVDQPDIVAAIEAIGGKSPRLLGPVPQADGYTEDGRGEVVIEAELLAQDEPSSHQQSDWVRAADRLRPIFEEVAATGGYTVSLKGKPVFIKATAAQVAALKVIFDRAEGRVPDKARQVNAPVGVVILPSEDFTCPRCGYVKK